MKNRFSIFICALLVVGGSGCKRQSMDTDPDPGVLPGRNTKPDTRNFRAIRLSLYSIEVPAGMVSGSEDVWSYLNEEAVGVETLTALGLNGLRVGLGQQSDWPYLAKLFRKLTGRKLTEGASTLRPGQVTQITLNVESPAKTLFIYQRDRTMYGSDFPVGDYLLAVSCTLDEDDPRKTLLTALPQMRTSQVFTRRKITDDKVQVVSAPDLTSFKSVMFRLSIPDDGFIVIGPGSQSRRKSSLGSVMLRREKKGLPFENVLILSAEIFSSRTTPVSVE